MVSFISLFEIISTVAPDPKLFCYIANDIKALLANGKHAVINGLEKSEILLLSY